MDRPRRNIQQRTHPDGTPVRSYGEAATTAATTVATNTDNISATNTSTNTNTVTTSTAATSTRTDTNTGMNTGTNTSATNNNPLSMNPTQGGGGDEDDEIILMGNDDNSNKAVYTTGSTIIPIYPAGRIDPIMYMEKKLPLLSAMAMRRCQQAFRPQPETGLDTSGEEANRTPQQREMVHRNSSACAILITVFTKNKSMMSIIQQTTSSSWPSG